MIPKDELTKGGVYFGFEDRTDTWCNMVWDGEYFYREVAYASKGWPPSPYLYYSEDTPYARFCPRSFEYMFGHEED